MSDKKTPGGLLADFQRFALFVRNNVLATLLGLLTLAMLIMLVLVWENREVAQSIANPPNLGREHFENALATNEQVLTALRNLSNDLGAERVAVRQFSNGTTDLSGVPFLRVTDTYTVYGEHAHRGYDANDATPVPLSGISRTLSVMWKVFREPVCVAQPSNQYPDPQLRSWLISQDYHYAVKCPMVNLGGYPVGILVVDFKDIPEERKGEALEKTRITAERITGYLQQTVDRQKKGPT